MVTSTLWALNAEGDGPVSLGGMRPWPEVWNHDPSGFPCSNRLGTGDLAPSLEPNAETCLHDVLSLKPLYYYPMCLGGMSIYYLALPLLASLR
jgi:hypothetical protein